MVDTVNNYLGFRVGNNFGDLNAGEDESTAVRERCRHRDQYSFGESGGALRGGVLHITARSTLIH